MDGDGDKDCPYEFKDKTEHNNGVANTKKPTEEKPSQPNQESKLTFRKLCFILFGGLLSLIPNGFIYLLFERYSERVLNKPLEETRLNIVCTILNYSILIIVVLVIFNIKELS